MAILDLLSILARANLAAGAAVLAVVAMRRLVRPRFGARAAYALWVAPLLAAVAAVVPHPTAAVATVQPVVVSLAAAAEQAVPAAVTAPESPWPTILAALWLAGCAVAVALLARRQAAYVTSLGRLEPLSASEPGVLRAQRSGIGPAVVGALRPKIVAPADFEARFGEAERALILAHERVHLAAGDAAVNALAALLQCLCWFNPLAHLAARLMRVDQEFACDAAVVARFPQAKRPYAELLLKTQLVTQPLPIGCHWPARSAHPLKERIAMLKSPLPEPGMRTLGLVVAGCLAVGAGGLAWAAQPGARGALTDAAPVGAIPNNGHLEPAEAAKLVGPGQTMLCKPDANRELHNCKIGGTPFAVIATAADVEREWPAQAKAKGLTGWVVLRCTANAAHGRLEGCEGYHYGGAAERPELRAAFEKAAVRVAAVIRLKTNPGPDDAPLPKTPGFYTIEFSHHPHMPGGPPGDPPTTRYPDFLPDRDGKVISSANAGPGSAQRREALRQLALHPDYTCDPEGERKGIGCKIILQSNWLALPTPADVARAYPAEARRIGASALVAVRCGIEPNGLLTACSVLSADLDAPHREAMTPQMRTDFGRAALQLTRYFQSRPPPSGFPKSSVAQFMVAISDGSRAALPTADEARGRPMPPLPPTTRPPRTPVKFVSPASQVAAFLQSPNWARRPTLEDLVKAYPAEAAKNRVEGDVVLQCHVSATGKLTNCTVLRETPDGAGFGLAALKLTPLFEAREEPPEGAPKRGTDIRLPIRFRLPAPSPAPAD